VATSPSDAAHAGPVTQSEPPKKPKRRRVFLVVAVVVLLVAGTIFHFLTREPSSLELTGVVTTDDFFAKNPDQVLADLSLLFGYIRGLESRR